MSEWWFWELVCFFSGEFGSTSLAAHTVAYQLAPLSFMVPLGFSQALTARVGALLAEGRVAVAKRVTVWALGLCMATVSCNVLLVFLFQVSRRSLSWSVVQLWNCRLSRFGSISC